MRGLAIRILKAAGGELAKKPGAEDGPAEHNRQTDEQHEPACAIKYSAQGCQHGLPLLLNELHSLTANKLWARIPVRHPPDWRSEGPTCRPASRMNDAHSAEGEANGFVGSPS